MRLRVFAIGFHLGWLLSLGAMTWETALTAHSAKVSDLPLPTEPERNPVVNPKGGVKRRVGEFWTEKAITGRNPEGCIRYLRGGFQNGEF